MKTASARLLLTHKLFAKLSEELTKYNRPMICTYCKKPLVLYGCVVVTTTKGRITQVNHEACNRLAFSVQRQKPKSID